MGRALRGSAFLALAALVAVGAGYGLQARQNPAQGPTFRAGVNIVRVDVIVTDKSGAFVSNLTPDDFQITEQGKPQKIDTFRLVSLDGGLAQSLGGPPRAIASDEDEAREAARDDVRLFGIFLDDYHVSREASIQTRDIVAHFVANQLGPSDMIGLMRPLTPLSALLLTRNHDAVEKGIEQFIGRKGDYDPKNPAEENLFRQYFDKPAVMEQVRNQVSYSALESLVAHLGGFKEGRKTLILVTEGFAGGLREVELQSLYTDANRSNVSVYWIDPRRLGAVLPGNGEWIWGDFCGCLTWKPGPVSLRSIVLQQDPLKALSEYTDGRAIINRNDLSVAMQQIVRDSSGYYLLGYSSTYTGADGKFHEIGVHVTRPGVDVRARKGYWALNRDQLKDATTPPKGGPPTAIEHALNASTLIAQARFVRTWLGTERGENGKTRVMFVWEPATRLPRDSSPVSIVPSRIAVTAANVDGDPYFRGIAPAEPDASATGGHVTFEAAPGQMQLRLSVQASGNEVLDTETRDISIPDLMAPEISLSTPQVFRARTAREMQAIKADPKAVPYVGREFTRSDRLMVRVAGYGPANATPQLTVRLLGRAGDTVSALGALESPPRGGFRDVDIPLAALAAGEYLIEVTASGDSGHAQELVAIRVTG